MMLSEEQVFLLYQVYIVYKREPLEMQPTKEVQYKYNTPHQLQLYSLNTILFNNTAEKTQNTTHILHTNAYASFRKRKQFSVKIKAIYLQVKLIFKQELYPLK